MKKIQLFLLFYF